MKWLKIEKSSVKNITYRSDTGITLNAKPNDLLKKKVLLLFDSKDRSTIRELASEYISPKDEYDFFWIGGLFALYLTFLILASPLASENVRFFGSFQPGGILIFPLTFIILDSVNEIFQYRFARRMTFMGSGILFIAASLAFITIHVFEFSEGYRHVLGRLPLVYLISGVTLPIADQTNNIVFRVLRYRLALCPLWVRCFISTAIGQATYTLIWGILFFGTSINTGLMSNIIHNYGFKLVYAACLIPITYIIVAVYRARKPAVIVPSTVMEERL